MAKRIDKVYLNENNDIDTQNILIEGREKKDTAKKVGKGIWTVLRPITIFGVSLIVVIFGVKFAYDKVVTNFFAPVDSSSNNYVTVDIPKGSSLSDISEILEKNDIIRNKTVFKLYVDFSDMSSKLKAGTYSLSPNMEFDSIIYELRQGVVEASTAMITFPEGKTIEEYADILIKNGVTINKDDFIKECRDGTKYSDNFYVNEVLTKIEDTGKLRRLNLEGYLFPDTYDFFKEASEEDVVRKLLNRFEEIADPYLEKAEEKKMTMDDVIILASIIEKEGIPEDFTKISAVFYNRMKAKMPLQSDATLQYELNKGSVVLTEEELEANTAYSTHKQTGLPVGPISNPGKAAIEAALNPNEDYLNENYLYFCLTTPETGKSVFAKTLEEHNANVAQWRPTWE